MKKTNRKRILSVRLLAILIGIIMVASMLPIGTSAAAAKSVAVLDMFDSSVPAEYKQNVNPYGYAQGEAFMMAPQNELLLLSSYGRDDSDNELFLNRWFSGYTNKDVPMTAANWAGVSDYSPFEAKGDYSSKKGYAYTEAVAFDPNGTGRKDHVAYIALETSGRVVVYVMDTNTGLTSSAYGLGDASHLLGKIQNYEAGNFFSITAGNYSSDKGETFVVYAPLSDGNNTLMEYRMSYWSGGDIRLTRINQSTSYFHEVYRQEGEVDYFQGKTMSSDNTPRNMIQVNLATGDVNGDDMDDLIVLSYYTNPSGYSYLHIKHFSPQMIIAKGGGSGSILGRTANVKDKLFRRGYDGGFVTMNAPTVAAGDINGDGIDEIITAGWMRTLKKNTNDENLLKSYEEEIGVTVAVHEFTGAHIRDLMFESYDDVSVEDPILNKWSQSTANKNKDLSIMPPFEVECVAIDGDSNPEYIFLNGTFIKYENGQIAHAYTPEFFRSHLAISDSLAGVSAVNVGFIDSTAVGVFDKNTVGREEIMMSVGMKETGSSDYYYALGAMGGANYNDTKKTDSKGNEITVKYGTATDFYDSGFWLNDDFDKNYNQGWGCFITNKGSAVKQCLNFLVVAIDRGYDGVVARYASKGYEFANPHVTAVLQAAPYFGELGSYGDSSTEYSFTTSYVIGEQASNTTSFSVGASFEAEMPGFKFSLGSGYTESWSRSFESAYSEEHTTTFTAKDQNQVVLQRTPIIMYNYDVQDENGDWSRQIQVTVPGKPSYVLLTVEEYNAFADEYNSAAGVNRYKKITDSKLAGNAGNPGKYATSWGSGMTQLSASTYSVNSTSGSITSTYAKGTEDTTSVSTSQGYYVDMMVGTGGSFLVGSVYGGVETSIEGESSHGTFTTTAEYRSASGTVYGLGDLKEEMPSGILGQYGFNWSFGTWQVTIADGTKVPVYGYVVNNVSRAAASPGAITITDTDDENVMNVTYSTNVTGATHYNIYMLERDGKWTRLEQIAAPSSGTTEASVQVSFPNDYRDNSITLAVNAVVGGKETAMTEPVTYYKQNTALSAYQIACRNGFEGTEAEWIASLVGETGENGIDGVGITDIYIVEATGELIVILSNGEEMNLGIVIAEDGSDGNTPYIAENGNWWIADVDTGVSARGEQGIQGEKGDKGDKGDVGESGKDGREIVLRVADGYIQWQYEGDSEWQNLAPISSLQGEQGEQGEKGEKGDTGAQGEKGDPGEKGEKGDTGEPGASGCQSSLGISIVVVVTITTGAAAVLVKDKFKK